MDINIYTDGSFKGGLSKGFGGWAFAIEGERVIKRSGSVFDTTANRMELTAVLEGLVFAVQNTDRPLKEVHFRVHSDSAYVVNVIEKGWLFDWAEKLDWQNTIGEVKNKDLWQAVYYLVRLLPQVTFIHVRGHTGIELNELCDKLAKEEAQALMEEFETPEEAAARREFVRSNYNRRKNRTQRLASYRNPVKLLNRKQVEAQRAQHARKRDERSKSDSGAQASEV